MKSEILTQSAMRTAIQAASLTEEEWEIAIERYKQILKVNLRDRDIDDEAEAMYKEWRNALYRSKKFQETDNFQETAWYYIDQIQNDEFIPPQDWDKQFKRKLKEEEDD